MEGSMHMSTQKRTIRRNVCWASVVLTLLLVVGADLACAQGTTTQDIVITKPTDKSSPKLATQSADEVRGICGKNPNCRVVRDDAAITAFCVGDNCVAAKKKTGKPDVFLRVTITEAMVSNVARIQGRPITTSQGIIAILIGNIAPPATAPSASKSGSPSTTKAGYDIKQNVKAPPAANLTEGGGTSAPSAPGPGRAGAIKKDSVAPALGGSGKPMMGQ
jgi:hypothetical protein